MATSVNLGYCPWLAGATWTDQLGRLDVAGETFLGATRGGVLNSVASPLAVTTASGMNISVAPGTCVIPSSVGASNGGYRVMNPIAQTLTVNTAPTSPNSRIDIVTVTIIDNGDATSQTLIQIVSGTAASSPVAPALPANSIQLATITVGTSVSSIVQANIADNRIYAANSGGVVVCPNMGALPAGFPGLIGYDVAHDRFFELGASGALPFKTMGFTPGHVVDTSNSKTIAGNTGGGASYATIMSANVTLDGSTDLMITVHWAGLVQATAVYGQILMGIFIDATQLDEVNIGTVGNATFNGLAVNGNEIIYITNAALGNTPSAGAHTVSWQAKASWQTSSMSTLIRSNTAWPAFLRVQPVTL